MATNPSLPSRNPSQPEREVEVAVEVAVEVTVEVALAGLFRRGSDGIEILAARRFETAIRGGLWEFPGGKIEAGETPDRAVIREVLEEVAIDASAFLGPLHPLDVVEHSDPRLERERTVRLHPFLVEVKPTVEPRAVGSSEVRWIRLEEFGAYAWPKANTTVHESILRFFASRNQTPDSRNQDPA